MIAEVQIVLFRFPKTGLQSGKLRHALVVRKLPDTSAEIDVFWLPAKGRKTILISPMEQARLMHRQVAGK
jgi:hypothetical protein